MVEYDKLLRELDTDIIANRVIRANYGKPIYDIYNMIQLKYIKHTSYNWFNGDIVLVYPSIKEVRSKKHYDSMHGAYIGLNSLYINYHALLVNITNGNRYVLTKPLRFELGDNLPMNISDLEELERTTGVDISIRRVDKTFMKCQRWH